MLDYGCCVWSPYQAKYVDQLESVQTFAARLAMKKWSSDSATLRSLLGWSTLASRRTYMKLCLCRRILVGDSLIPDSTFSPHTSRTVRHINSCPLYQPFVKTSYHLNSFFISVIPLWNSIPDQVICASSVLTFKRHSCLILFNFLYQKYIYNPFLVDLISTMHYWFFVLLENNKNNTKK